MLTAVSKRAIAAANIDLREQLHRESACLMLAWSETEVSLLCDPREDHLLLHDVVIVWVKDKLVWM